MSAQEDLKEIARLAAEAVVNDFSGELPYQLLGVGNYNRLIDLLVGLGDLPDSYLKEKREVEPPVEKKAVESKPSPPTPYGLYTIRYSRESWLVKEDG